MDPSHGSHDPGPVGTAGATQAEVTWKIAALLTARLRALGADIVLSRGPRTTPSGSDRARLANELAVDVVVSVGVNALGMPAAQGAATYYFGAEQFVSEAGRRLADLVQDAMVAAGWLPDCRTHPMSWAILRETRMPAVVAEPGFITSPDDERRLSDAGCQRRLADALALAVDRFFAEAPAEPPHVVPGATAGALTAR